MIIAILVGGTSTRFHINKLTYPVRGRPLINYIVENVRRCRSAVKVVLVATPQTFNQYRDIDVDVVIDFLAIGPMGGIYAVLKMFGEVMVLAGDMPFINCRYVEKMVELCKGYRYACLPMWIETGFLEPLAGIYSKEILPIIEQGLVLGELSIQRLIKKLNLGIKAIPIEIFLRDFVNMFMNINRFEDIEEVVYKT